MIWSFPHWIFSYLTSCWQHTCTIKNEEGTSLGITITTGCNLSDHAVVAFENVSSCVGKKMATVYISPVILPFTVYFTIKLLSWQKLEEWRICQGKAGFYIGMLSTIIGKHIQDIQHTRYMQWNFFLWTDSFIYSHTEISMATSSAHIYSPASRGGQRTLEHKVIQPRGGTPW